MEGSGISLGFLGDGKLGVVKEVGDVSYGVVFAFAGYAEVGDLCR